MYLAFTFLKLFKAERKGHKEVSVLNSRSSSRSAYYCTTVSDLAMLLASHLMTTQLHACTVSTILAELNIASHLHLITQAQAHWDDRLQLQYLLYG